MVAMLVKLNLIIIMKGGNIKMSEHESYGGHHSHSKKDNSITIKKDTLWKVGTFVFAALFLLVLYNGGSLGGGGGGTVVQPNQPSAVNPPTQAAQVTASIDDDAILGNKDAPITIIEFSDYQCPFCNRFWAQTLPQLKSEYIDTGKVRFVYRDFTLDSIHPFATPAAQAAECVRDQGGDKAYYEYHDKVFENYQSLSNENLKQWAQGLGYDIGSCLDSGKFAAEVKKDTADAQAAGGQGTPYFVIIGKDGKGTPLSGAQPFAAFDAALKAAGA